MEKVWENKVEYIKGDKVKLVDLESVAKLLEDNGWERKDKPAKKSKKAK